MSLFTQPVGDYVERRDRKAGGEAEGTATAGGDSKKTQFGGAGGNTANSGAFVLRESIKSNREQLEHGGNKTDDLLKTNIPKGFFEFVYGENYYNFLEALLEYCRELFRLENK
jgi:hypothetical protein